MSAARRPEGAQRRSAKHEGIPVGSPRPPDGAQHESTPVNADTQALARRLVNYLETGEPAPGLFTEDVFCDFTLPRWRLQARGLAGVLALRRQGHPSPGTVPRWHAEATPGGYVLEGDWYCREMMQVHLRGPSIARLAVYCTGDWDAARQAEHGAAVTLLEP